MDIVSETKKLDLPFGRYILVGSAPMVIREIREAADLDIIVTKDIFEELLLQKGWISKTTPDGRRGIENDECEIFDRFFQWEGCPGSTEELISDAEIIHGLPFLRLGVLIECKKAMGREKDLADVTLIEKYLISNT